LIKILIGYFHKKFAIHSLKTSGNFNFAADFPKKVGYPEHSLSLGAASFYPDAL
jgi:hypothetical protein